MYVNSSLSNSEWTTALKLSVGYGNLRGDGYRRGRQDELGQPILGKTTTQCRRCRAEKPFHMCLVLALMASLCVEPDMTSSSID